MKNNRQQTAVEWLIEKQLDAGIGLPKEWREQAKEMEKEKLEDSWVEGTIRWGTNRTFEQYYEQTYGGGEQ